MSATPLERPIRVFVHLAYGFGAAQWLAKWERGEIIGLNERLPYGYFWAEDEGCAVEYSEDGPESWLIRALRLGMRVLLGFDFVHAWRNRRGIRNAEIVWTHTESKYLAVLLLLCGRRRSPRPKIIAQSVWLFDAWPRLWLPKRWLYARLIAGADMLTVHSPENLKVARTLFPRQRSGMIPYGVKADGMVCPAGAQHIIRCACYLLAATATAIGRLWLRRLKTGRNASCESLRHGSTPH